MYKIQTLNKVSSIGMDLLPHDNYEYASEIIDPDAIIVRSAKMHDMDFSDNLKTIARAGAGTNNIPIEKCSEKGIVVFNTPGANANGVKEMILLGLFIASRKVYRGIKWAKSLNGKGDEVPKLIEKGKSDFTGPEIKGKKLAIIGLGAIGVMAANDATSLGMEVSGFDPFISVDSAWGLSRSVKKAISLDSLISDADYISLNIPLNDKTKGFINKDKFDIMKDGVRILNFARGGLVNNDDLKTAIADGKVAAYVTDFPDESLLDMDEVVPIPHLGASTPESEENCAVMAVKQMKEFLENGNIINSVNFPNASMAKTTDKRIIIANKNVPNIIGQITHILAEKNINIADMLNKSRDDYAYNIIDTDQDVSDIAIKELEDIEGVIMVRVL